VQHVFGQQQARVAAQLFDGQARLFVCGNVGMSKAIEEILKKWLVERHGGNAQRAEAEFAKLQNDKRICIEAWG
jgi:sulfite reductase alpha subunit-like flavoprotein